MPRMSKARDREGIGFPGALVPSLIPLVFRIGKTYLRFKKDAQRASRIFEKELRANGLDKRTAKAMTELYIESSRILRTFDFSRLAMSGMAQNDR